MIPGKNRRLGHCARAVVWKRVRPYNGWCKRHAAAATAAVTSAIGGHPILLVA
jgi:hypothetical protein